MTDASGSAPAPFAGLETAEARIERGRVAAGELPRRYGEPWGRPFFEAAAPALQPGAVILDVGAGRSPILPPEARPHGARYIGLDVSESELRAAPPGAYDETIVGDVTRRHDALAGRVDLILSWQVLEHVSSMAAALESMRAYLRPGGRMVALLSGRFAAFSLLGRVVPYRVSRLAMERLLGADPEAKFPTRYDGCTFSELDRLLAGWSAHEIVPRYKGAGYFRFWRALERAYLRYEDWAERRDRRDLATHYLIVATR